MQQNVDIFHEIITSLNMGSTAISYITINKLYHEYTICFANNNKISHKQQLAFRKAMREAFPRRMRSNAVVYIECRNSFVCQIKPGN